MSGTGVLSGAVAVVTGGASGMGLATVQRFVAEGASVVVADLNVEAGERVAAELGDAVRFERCDVSVEADVAAVVRAAVDSFGRLDIMFNNAGVGGAFGPITEIESDDWDTTFGVLVRGVFTGTKHAARQMIEQGARRVDHQHSVGGRPRRWGRPAGLLSSQGSSHQPDRDHRERAGLRTRSGSMRSARASSSRR